MNLSIKFGLVVVLLLIVTFGGGVGQFVFSERELQRLQEQNSVEQEEAMLKEARLRASMVASFGEACRDYTQKILSPAVERYTQKQLVFEAQSRTFVARGTFEQFKQKSGMSGYAFREASLNPLNRTNNLADADEKKLIEIFSANRENKDQSGFLNKNGAEFFFVARPIVVDKSCLRCHDSPGRAPKEIADRYGTESGFGWKEGEINSILMVTVPADDLKAQAAISRQQALDHLEKQRGVAKNLLIMFAAMGALLLLALFGLFHFLVNRRIRHAADVMREVATNSIAAVRIRDRRGDDIGVMAQTFDRMADALAESQSKLETRVNERTNELLAANEALKREVTMREQKELELANAQKLESVGQLAAGIAHEINTPIQYIGDNTAFLGDAFEYYHKTFADLTDLWKAAHANQVTSTVLENMERVLSEGDLDYLQEEIPKSISQTLEGVAHVAKIVRAMKEFSHPGGEEKASLDINRAIENTLTVTRNEWKHVADVVTDLDPALPYIPGYPGELNQVLLNLIVNASHAVGEAGMSPANGKGKITLGTRRLPGKVEIRVSDTGCGIPAAIRSRIFDPFFTTKAVGKGTGQGLAITRAIVVEKHKGSITFESEVGKGTTFVLTLPEALPAAQEALA